MTTLREAAHTAYLEWSAEQSDRRARQFSDWVRRANRALDNVLGFGPAQWERAGAGAEGIVDITCILDGVNLGAELDGSYLNTEVILRCMVFNSDGNLAWRTIYSLADLGRYLAEHDDYKAFAQ